MGGWSEIGSDPTQWRNSLLLTGRAISNSPKNPTHTFTFLKIFRLRRNYALSLMLKVGENCKQDMGLLKQLLFITQKRVPTQHLIKYEIGQEQGAPLKQDMGLLKQFITQKRVSTQHLVKHS